MSPARRDLPRPTFTTGALPATVPDDFLCAACMYELAGLDSDAVCPECGKPIAESLTGDPLAAADEKWLRKVHGGFRLVTRAATSAVVCFCLSLIFMIGSMVYLTYHPSALNEARLDTAGDILAKINLAAVVVAPIVAMLGWFAATSPEPGHFDERIDRIRARARWSFVIWVAACFILFAATSIISAFATTLGASTTLTVLGVLGVASSAHYWHSMQHIRILANRVPDPKLVRKARTERQTLIIGSTLGVLACGIGPLVAFVVYLGILDRVHSTLRPIVQEQARREHEKQSTT